MSFYDYSERLAQTAAAEMTRRRMFRRAGHLSLAVATGAALLDRAAGTAVAKGTPSHPCGPSSLCTYYDGHCKNGACNVQDFNVHGRIYDQYICASAGGCWTEDYTRPGLCRGMWTCCDCCTAKMTTTRRCSGAAAGRCGGSSDSFFYACICRRRLVRNCGSSPDDFMGILGEEGVEEGA